VAPADGLRLLAPGSPEARSAGGAVPAAAPLAPGATAATVAPADEAPPASPDRRGVTAPAEREPQSPGDALRRSPSPADLAAVARDTWSLRVTLDADAKRDLDLLRDLLAHDGRGRDL